MLKLQLELGFKAFEAKYGDVECGLNISNGNFLFCFHIHVSLCVLNLQAQPCVQIMKVVPSLSKLS